MKLINYFIVSLSISVIITTIIMLTVCNDINFYDNQSSVCGINISAIMFVIYVIIILFILSILICIIQCYTATNYFDQNTKIYIIHKNYDSINETNKIIKNLNKL
jgi:hypothetical protein